MAEVMNEDDCHSTSWSQPVHQVPCLECSFSLCTKKWHEQSLPVTFTTAFSSICTDRESTNQAAVVVTGHWQASLVAINRKWRHSLTCLSRPGKCMQDKSAIFIWWLYLLIHYWQQSGWWWWVVLCIFYFHLFYNFHLQLFPSDRSSSSEDCPSFLTVRQSSL